VSFGSQSRETVAMAPGTNVTILTVALYLLDLDIGPEVVLT
jgi:hypothetical protein